MNTTLLVRGAATTGVVIFSAAALAQTTATAPSTASSSGGATMAACSGKPAGTAASYVDSGGQRVSVVCTAATARADRPQIAPPIKR